MSFARPRALFASTSFRLSLAFAAVLFLAFASAGVGLWFLTKSAAEQTGRERIRLEMDALQAEIRERSLEEAIAEIHVRERKPGSLEYLLLAADGGVLAGNLQIEPPPFGWSTIYLPNTAGETASPDLVLLSEPVPGGGSLVIAENLEPTEWVRYAILRTLFWVAAGALILSVAAGYLAASGTLRRMDGVFQAMERVGAGDLSARVPVGARTDGSDVDVLGRRINAMLARIDTLVSNLRRVSTDIAHDLRTPLSHVRQRLDDVAAAESLDAARTAAAAAQDKIEDVLRTFAAMLRLAEIEAGSAHARFGPVDLAAIVERVAHAYRPDIEGSGRTFSVSLPARAMVAGDADLLAQALANLLDNAMVHTPRGAPIAVRLSEDAGGVRLTIQDEGPGIPLAERTRALEPFVRLDGSRTSSGAGLGLSIVNAIARLHGAQLALHDARPGLRVEIVWPASTAMSDGAPAHAAEAAPT